MRYGFLGGDDSLNLEARGLKWFRPSNQLWLKTANEEVFWRKHREEHSEDALREFEEKVILAPPRDLPPELESLRVLLDPHTKPREVRRVCKKSKYWRELQVLHKHAEQFCQAKRDKRYPRSDHRPSNEGKRIAYLASAMAGLSLNKPLAPATAVDLLRKMKHPRGCRCWRCEPKSAAPAVSLAAPCGVT